MPARSVLSAVLRLADRPRAHLWLAMGSALLALVLVDFSVPETVRGRDRGAPLPVGVPPAEAVPAGPPEAGTVRVQARLWAAGEDDDLAPAAGEESPPEERPGRQLLAAPVVTTVLGVPARVQQRIDLPSGPEVDLRITVVPRAEGRGRSRRLHVAYAVRAEALQRPLWGLGRRPRPVPVVDVRGDAGVLDDASLHVGFTVDGARFILEIAAQAPASP